MNSAVSLPLAQISLSQLWWASVVVVVVTQFPSQGVGYEVLAM